VLKVNRQRIRFCIIINQVRKLLGLSFSETSKKLKKSITSCMLLVACRKKNKSEVVPHDFDAEYVFVPELLKNTTRLLSIKPPGNNIFPVVKK